MARYWNEMNYPQPTEEELKENAKNTRKKAAAKGQTLGARRGVRIWNATPILIPDCRAADAMSARAR